MLVILYPTLNKIEDATMFKLLKLLNFQKNYLTVVTLTWKQVLQIELKNVHSG